MGKPELESLRSTNVPIGISLIYCALALMLASIILMFVVPLAMSGNPLLAVRAIVGLGVLLLVASILSLVGTGLCLTAPQQMPGKEAIYLTVGLDVVVVLIHVAGNFTRLPVLIAALPNLLAITGFVSFLVFLKHVSGFVGSSELVSKAEGSLGLGIALVIVLGLSIVGTFVMPQVAGAFAVLALILGAVGFLRYARLLHDLKHTLAHG